jgi:hypothetical protein
VKRYIYILIILKILILGLLATINRCSDANSRQVDKNNIIINDSFNLKAKVTGEGAPLLLVPDGFTGWKCCEPTDSNVIDMLPGIHLM